MQNLGRGNLSQTIDGAKRLYRWVVGTPYGAFIGVFVGLQLILVIGSIADHPLSAHHWFQVTTEMLPVAALFGLAVWVRTSSWSPMIKPAHLSWLGVTMLGLQIFIGGLIAYVVLANQLGYLHPQPSATPKVPIQAAGSWGITSIAAAIGLHQDRWWAYFLELGVLWLLIAAVIMNPLPTTIVHHNSHLEIPYVNEFGAYAQMFAFLSFNWWSIRRGLLRYKEQNAETA